MTQDAATQKTDKQPAPSKAERARSWWRQTCSDDQGDRATRARLRRCDNAQEALAIPAALLLVRWLGLAKDLDDPRHARAVDRALGLAIVLAHIREDTPGRPVMRALGWRSFPGERKESDAGEERPALSDLRFRRLLQCETETVLLPAFIRLARFLDGKADIADLAQSYLEWGDRIRRRWAFQYYAAEIAIPPTDKPEPEEATS